MVSQSRVDAYIGKYKACKKAELRAILRTLNSKSKTTDVQAQIKAIIALLA